MRNVWVGVSLIHSRPSTVPQDDKQYQVGLHVADQGFILRKVQRSSHLSVKCTVQCALKAFQGENKVLSQPCAVQQASILLTAGAESF